MYLLEEYPSLKVIQSLAKKRRVDVRLVGGFPRDYLIGRPCVDFDFAVEKDALSLASAFARQIKGVYVLLDEEHGCARVVKRNAGRIWTFDFADFRAATFRGDLAHRDFTINTFSIPLLQIMETSEASKAIAGGKSARDDLDACSVRMVSAKTFKEDPLRLLRAFSLQAQLGFSIEKLTMARIRTDKDLIRTVSFERIRDELFKILESGRAAANLRAMDAAGLLPCFMPHIAVMYKVKQGTYHHLDVWKHSLETVSQLEKIFKETENDLDVRSYIGEKIAGGHSRGAVMKLGALWHDIGKPQTLRREKDRISFHGHEHVGKNITRSLCKYLKISTKERFVLEDLVLWHLRPGYLSNFKSPSDRAIFRYMRDTKDEAASIALLSLADQRSTRGPATTEADQRHHEKICRDLVRRFFDKKKEQPFVRLIDGHDLIRVLKLKPSPLFSEILRDVEEKQAMGQIQTKKEALDLAARTAKRHAN